MVSGVGLGPSCAFGLLNFLPPQRFWTIAGHDGPMLGNCNLSSKLLSVRCICSSGTPIILAHSNCLADADFVSGPEGSCGVVADDWFAVALYFYDCGGLVGGL